MPDITVAEEVRAIIVDNLNLKYEEAVDSAVFRDDLGADSLDVVELVLALESKFDISIADDQAEKIKTVGDAIAFVENALK